YVISVEPARRISYGQFIQPKSNLAAEHSLRSAGQAAFSQLTAPSPHSILRISPGSLGVHLDLHLAALATSTSHPGRTATQPRPPRPLPPWPERRSFRRYGGRGGEGT